MEQTAELYQLVRAQARLETAAFVERYVDLPHAEDGCRGCPNVGQYWTCPPYAFPAAAYWGRFREIELIGQQMHFSDAALAKTYPPEELEELERATARGRGAARRAGGQRAADRRRLHALRQLHPPAGKALPPSGGDFLLARVARLRRGRRRRRSLGLEAPLGRADASARVSDACLRGASAVKNVPCLQTVGKFLRILYKFANRGCNSCIF